jgi:hypothetical protein
MASVWDFVRHGRPDDDADRKGPQTRRPKQGERLSLLPLESQVGWYFTHFIGRRTRPCLGDRCPCQGSAVKVENRWVGWILAIDETTQRVVLASLTENTFKTCQALRDRSIDLRSCRLILQREADKPNGRVKAEVQRNCGASRSRLVLPYTQRDQLLRVWFNAKDDYAEVALYQDLAGKTEPDQAAEDLVEPGPNEEVDG